MRNDGNSKRIFIYQHVPKCAGQSFRAACANYFALVLEKPPGKNDPAAWAEFVGNKVDCSMFEPDSMICGHLIHDGVRPRERYADEIARGNVHILTLLRDPMERAISAHFYRLRQGKAGAPSVEAHLTSMKNPISHHLGYFEGGAREFLAGFYLVAVAEYLQNSMELLAKLIGREPVRVRRINATPRKPYEVSADVVEAFKRNNERDYALYRQAIILLEERYAEHFGRPFPETTLLESGRCEVPTNR
jgi:hypothetical protein